MRIFLAGATGAIGSRLVPLLLDAGHEVAGTTRSPAKAEALRAAGAEPVVLDALDRTAVVDAVASARPDAVVHQLTALADMGSMRRAPTTCSKARAKRASAASSRSRTPAGPPAAAAGRSRPRTTRSTPIPCRR